MAETLYVAADEVQTGMFIPGLDNAYVIDVDTNFDIRNGDYNTSFGDGCVLVTYNDRDGEEGHLFLTQATRIEVTR